MYVEVAGLRKLLIKLSPLWYVLGYVIRAYTTAETQVEIEGITNHSRKVTANELRLTEERF